MHLLPRQIYLNCGLVSNKLTQSLCYALQTKSHARNSHKKFKHFSSTVAESVIIFLTLRSVEILLVSHLDYLLTCLQRYIISLIPCLVKRATTKSLMKCSKQAQWKTTILYKRLQQSDSLSILVCNMSATARLCCM